MIDERLLLYYYDDGLTEPEKRDIAATLERDTELAGRYRALVRDLESLTGTADIVAPPELRVRLHATLDRAADLDKGRDKGRDRGRAGESRHRSHGYSFLLGAGVTAALAAVLVLAIGPAMRPDGTAVAPETLSAAVPERYEAAGNEPTFTRAMQVYFRDSREDLQSLPDTGNGERSGMVRDLIEQNRAFARLAVQNDAADLARVLRAFEPILARLAAEDVTAEESEALRAQLAFELNVMLTKLTREASEIASSTEQESST